MLVCLIAETDFKLIFKECSLLAMKKVYRLMGRAGTNTGRAGGGAVNVLHGRNPFWQPLAAAFCQGEMAPSELRALSSNLILGGNFCKAASAQSIHLQ